MLCNRVSGDFALDVYATTFCVCSAEGAVKVRGHEPPIHKHGLAKTLSLLRFGHKKSRCPLCSPASHGSSCFTSNVRKVAACSSRISRSCFIWPDGTEWAAFASVCLGSAAPVYLEDASFSVASPPAFLTLRQGPVLHILRSNGKTVRKCSSNTATDSKC